MDEVRKRFAKFLSRRRARLGYSSQKKLGEAITPDSERGFQTVKRVEGAMCAPMPELLSEYARALEMSPKSLAQLSLAAWDYPMAKALKLGEQREQEAA